MTTTEKELTQNEITILKEIVKNVKHHYTRAYQCICGHVSDQEYGVFSAYDHNCHSGFVCPNCGEHQRWHDIKIKHITCDLRKVINIKVIEAD
jgi:transcription initiation factor IIE alpha subunit